MVTLELLFKGGAFMSPQVDMEKKALEKLFLDAYEGQTKIVHINEVFVNIDEIQFIKVVEIPATQPAQGGPLEVSDLVVDNFTLDSIRAEYPTEITLGDLV